ncbi:hypothetical protein [Nocardia tengchongensis]
MTKDPDFHMTWTESGPGLGVDTRITLPISGIIFLSALLLGAANARAGLQVSGSPKVWRPPR